MSTTRLATFVSANQVAKAYLVLSGLAWLASFHDYPVVWLALFPDKALNGAYWQLATYAIIPYSLGPFFVISALMLWLGSHIEPQLGRVGTSCVYVSGAIAGGITYAILAPANDPLVGGIFVVSAAGSAFIVCSFIGRDTIARRQALFTVLAIAWATWILIHGPLYFSLIHSTSWIAGASAALLSMRHMRTDAATAHVGAQASAANSTNQGTETR